MTPNICKCGRLVTAGRTGDGRLNTRCIVCQTAHALGTPTPRKIRRAPAEYVREARTGVRGRILRRVWLVDLKTDAPAELAYVVRFSDGREKRVMPSEIVKEGN
jgi:hypothetical protein